MRPEQGPLWGCDAEEAESPTTDRWMHRLRFGGDGP